MLISGVGVDRINFEDVKIGKGPEDFIQTIRITPPSDVKNHD
jgi:hypothetical protein